MRDVSAITVVVVTKPQKSCWLASLHCQFFVAGIDKTSFILDESECWVLCVTETASTDTDKASSGKQYSHRGLIVHPAMIGITENLLYPLDESRCCIPLPKVGLAHEFIRCVGVTAVMGSKEFLGPPR